MINLGGSLAVFDCPHCEIKGCQQQRVGDVQARTTGRPMQFHGVGYGLNIHQTHTIYRCCTCGRDTYILVHRWDQLTGHRAQGEPEEVFMEPGSEAAHVWPVATPLVHSSIPPIVASAAIEAEKCFAVGAFSACGTMVRRAVDAMAQEKKAEGKDLFSRLAHLKDSHVITPTLWEWAEELRTAGKVGAHPEWEAMDSAEAEYAVGFLREILRYVYINPSELEARRLKQNKKKV
jgi:Domain of unknown function (DUF4145)